VTKLIWMSDPHFLAEGDVAGHDPRRRLSAAVEYVNRHHNDSEMCIISGDLVNLGGRADYIALKSELDRLQMPYLPMMGNHDERAVFRSVLQVPEGCMEEFVQFSLPISDGLIICLDTHKVGSSAGEFCQARQEWLRDILTISGDTPVFLFLHHPPMPLGLPMQDQIGMEGGAGFLDLIAGFENVSYMFIGHVHRPISGVVRGIGYSTMRSVLYQAPPPRPSWDWDSFSPAQEAPQIGVVTLNGPEVCLHYEQFCRFETGVAL